MSASPRHDKNQNYNVDEIVEGLEAFLFPVEADIYILTDWRERRGLPLVAGSITHGTPVSPASQLRALARPQRTLE